LPLIQGCYISFPATELETIDYVGVHEECNRKPKVSFEFEFKKVSPRHGYTEDNIKDRKRLFKQSFMDSGFFESVQEKDAGADIYVKVVHTFIYEPGWAEGVSIATLGIIPTVDSEGLDLQGEISRDGESIGFQYYDEINTARWILFLPFPLFVDDDRASKNVTSYRYKMIINEILSSDIWSCSGLNTGEGLDPQEFLQILASRSNKVLDLTPQLIAHSV